jgi:hypothetical protein
MAPDGLTREDSRSGREIFDNRIRKNVSPVGAAGFTVFVGFPGNPFGEPGGPSGLGIAIAAGRAL